MKLDLVVAIPTAGTVAMEFAHSLAALMTFVSQNSIRTLPEATQVTISMDIIQSSNWITNREQLAHRAINAGRTHLMFLDDDMQFEPQVLEVLMGRRQPIVATNYLFKTPNPGFMATGLDGQRIATTAASMGVQPIDFAGFGVSVIDVNVFKAMDAPRFEPGFDLPSMTYATEDVTFFRKAREKGFQAYVDHDASKLVSHVGKKIWNWPEYAGKPANA